MKSKLIPVHGKASERWNEIRRSENVKLREKPMSRSSLKKKA
jgi:hypothetical protein